MRLGPNVIGSPPDPARSGKPARATVVSRWRSVSDAGRDRERAHSARRLLRALGPEMVSGASDNDPTNVGTAAVVGAQTAYQLCWVALLVAPLLGVVQTI